MFGWEFPPFFAGGVGVVCFEMVRALSKAGMDVTYVMPFGPKNITSPYAKVLIAENILPGVTVKTIPTMMQAYMSEQEYDQSYQEYLRNSDVDSTKVLYSSNLWLEVQRFAKRATLIARHEKFDVIHAHDWMTFPAAVEAKKISGKPLVVHIHNTIYDRYLGSGGEAEKEIELMGMHYADKIVAISYFVKNRLVNDYHISPERIEVIHNAAIAMDDNISYRNATIQDKDKVVLFAGRVTVQKGPDYFVEAAKKVLDKNPNVKFILAGTGDMLPRMINRAAELGIVRNFIFPGFYSREDAERLFSMADVFVMPSVSEPFGIVPLEAMSKSKPVIISKQSGVAEIVHHALKVDFWDVDDIANKILAVLNYPSLQQHLGHSGKIELKNITWDEFARKTMDLYYRLVIP
ncbi:MAG: glycosyltransferase family 4 protein [Candidatus Woesearchaeota archaeon]